MVEETIEERDDAGRGEAAVRLAYRRRRVEAAS